MMPLIPGRLTVPRHCDVVHSCPMEDRRTLVFYLPSFKYALAIFEWFNEVLKLTGNNLW